MKIEQLVLFISETARAISMDKNGIQLIYKDMF